MAHTYTTARGKTKKAKEGIRKDAKNNAATKLMTKITQATPKSQEDVPIAKCVHCMLLVAVAYMGDKFTDYSVQRVPEQIEEFFFWGGKAKASNYYGHRC